LLLEGNPGTGRQRFADALASQLLCEAPTEEGACGRCKACELFAAGTHADYLRLAPAEEGKAIGIDSVREALRFLAATASLGRHKVLAVAPAEKLTHAAFNAFLKGLEEPPPHTTIVLVTARGYPIPATIRSRCQRWLLDEPDPDVAMQWVTDHLQDTDVSLKAAAGICELMPGRPFLALELLQSGAAADLLGFAQALENARASKAFERTRLRAALGAPAQRVDVLPMLAIAEGFFAAFLRTCSATQLRSRGAHRAFAGLADIERQRAAVFAGTNPNPDLLRHRTLEFLLDTLGADQC
jgi:DNA polymerase-3 subunit delta'